MRLLLLFHSGIFEKVFESPIRNNDYDFLKAYKGWVTIESIYELKL